VPAGLLYPNTEVTDAPQYFSGNVTVAGTHTTNGPLQMNGTTSVGTVNLGVAENQPGPSDLALLGWAYDPLAATTTSLSIGGTVYLTAIWLRQPMLVSNLWCIVTTVGAGLTASQNFLGLYNSSGTQVAVTADVSGSVPFITTSGTAKVAVTTPYNAPAGQYWMAMVFNGTTKPTLASAVSPSTYGHLTSAASAYRFAVNGTGQTTLPASITPSSNVTTGAFTYWAGVS
jgi:hypothetical protein